MRVQNINKKKGENKITFILFPVIFFLGIIGIMCFYAEHFIALNTQQWQPISFFGFIYHRDFVVDVLLFFGIVCFSISMFLMLFYFLYIVRKG